MILTYCSSWINQWERWQRETIFAELDKIEKEWKVSEERKNLIEWTAKKNGKKKELMAE